MPDERLTLPFQDLAARHRGVTHALAQSYAEAARVCLDRHHTSPIEFTVAADDRSMKPVAEWAATDERARAAWANEIDTTEAGAYALALAAVELANGMVAIRRAETRTGADYYLAPPQRGVDDLEDCYRLEVSGVDKGPVAIVQQRLQAKLEQARSGTSNLPAIAGVVGFRASLVLLQSLQA